VESLFRVVSRQEKNIAKEKGNPMFSAIGRSGWEGEEEERGGGISVEKAPYNSKN